MDHNQTTLLYVHKRKKIKDIPPLKQNFIRPSCTIDRSRSFISFFKNIIHVVLWALFEMALQKTVPSLALFRTYRPALCSIEEPQSQSLQSANVSGRSSELAPPPPPLQASVSPPRIQGGGRGTHSRAGKGVGGGGGQFRRRERHSGILCTNPFSLRHWVHFWPQVMLL